MIDGKRIIASAVNLARFVRLFTGFIHFRKESRQVYQRRVQPLCKPCLDLFEPEIQKRLQYRMWHYSTVVAPFFGPLLCRLSGCAVSPALMQTFTLAGAATAYFDMVFDDQLMDPETMAQKEISAFSPSESMYNLFYKILRDQAFDPVAFDRYLSLLTQVQRISQAQKDSYATAAWVDEVTRLKGGLGLLVFRCFVPVRIRPSEEAALMQAGEGIQLMDDLADIRQDMTEGIHTAARRFSSPLEFAFYVENQFPLIYGSLYKGLYSREASRRFCFELYCSFALGKVHAYRLTALCLKKRKTLQELNKADVKLKTDLLFWIRYVGEWIFYLQDDQT